MHYIQLWDQIPQEVVAVTLDHAFSLKETEDMNDIELAVQNILSKADQDTRFKEVVASVGKARRITTPFQAVILNNTLRSEKNLDALKEADSATLGEVMATSMDGENYKTTTNV